MISYIFFSFVSSARMSPPGISLGTLAAFAGRGAASPGRLPEGSADEIVNVPAGLLQHKKTDAWQIFLDTLLPGASSVVICYASVWSDQIQFWKINLSRQTASVKDFSEESVYT